jgi:hypothetical protein
MNKVKLHESLAMHLQDGGPLGRMIAHPMLYVIGYDAANNAQYNLQLLNKQAAAKKALLANDWHQNIFLHERPYRLEALVALHTVLQTCDRHDDAQRMLNEMLVTVYVDAEGLHKNAALWSMLFAAYTGERNRDRLPNTDTFMIYRGVSDARHTGGCSWTTNRKQAEWFASRWAGKGKGGHVFMRNVKADDVAMYTEDRGEAEVVFFK